jgi:hypothetical protein
MPQTITELSGIAGSGNVALPAPGTAVTDVEKVRTPVDETLYWVTELPLKLNVKGMVSVEDHAGEDWLGPKITVHDGSNPDPLGYSLSAFNPPGLPGEDAGM